MDNSPSENAILCQCILQLFEIPGQDKLIVKTTKRTVRKKQQEQKPQFELIPLELLQWWLYSLQFVEKAPQKLSKRQQKQINDFKQNFEALRRKYGQNSSMIKKKKSKRSTPLSKNHSSQKKGKGEYDDADTQCDPKLNLMSTLAKVKAHMDLYEQDQKVYLFKVVLMEDLTARSTKKKTRTSAKNRNSETSTKTADSADKSKVDDQK